LRKVRLSSYAVFLGFLFLISHLPSSFTQSTRNICIATVVPSWQMCHFLAHKIGGALSPSLEFSSKAVHDELQKLHAENHLLQTQIENMKAWLFHEERLEAQMQKWQQLGHIQGNEDFYQRRQKELAAILQLEFEAIPAKVIYREPTFWSSVIWINVGEKQNQVLGKKMICKNSVVTLGDVVVGIIEEVGNNKSKVRLITDSKLTPAVRAVRGKEQDLLLTNHIDSLLQLLETRQDLFSSKEEKLQLYSHLYEVKRKTERPFQDLYLAKGELYGGSFPLWRSRGELLKGIGFNYDFADEEGGGRDLRTGKLLLHTKSEEIPLLAEGDLLVTSGLDGIFLPGLKIAIATKIEQLQEGSSFYCLTAKSLVPDFQELETVFVLPPLVENE
jgi:cell shape-determining protein MreC